MAAMTTALTESTNFGNSRTSTTSGHTAVKPKLVIEKKKILDNNAQMAEYSFKVVHATTDVAGAVLSNKVSFEGVVRYPLLGNADDVAAAQAIYRDIVAGDEFANSVTTQNWLS